MTLKTETIFRFSSLLNQFQPVQKKRLSHFIQHKILGQKIDASGENRLVRD
jgi:hypothetical protein